MSQHDYNLANAPGATFRGDVNNALLAVVTNNAGPVAPVVTFPFMWWPDTGSNPKMLRQRNEADTAWIAIAQLSNFGMVSVQKQSATRVTLVNTALAYSGDQSPKLSGSLIADVLVNADNAAGSQPTFALNGDAAKNVVQYDSTGTKVPAILKAGTRQTWVDDGTDWVVMNPFSGSGSVANNTTYEFKNTITADYTQPANTNGVRVGPYTLAAGKKDTITGRMVVL